ncbi:MAG: ATP-binding cassette domain-containing protein [Lachnospiraceae bacterium]|nr:ATP-binding cassette domain-containing protein [Lachnospiraceae bacterium]
MRRWPLFQDFDLELHQGERVLLRGANGCGKSSLIKAVLRANGLTESAAGRDEAASDIRESGVLRTASGLLISYIDQDTSFLQGNLTDYCKKEALDESLFKAILRQLDLERTQFSGRMEAFSEGQKKKVLIAASLLKKAHLYIWDEPLNYIDIFSRIQIENLLLRYQPTMLIVEHDIRFQEKIADRVVELG